MRVLKISLSCAALFAGHLAFGQHWPVMHDITEADLIRNPGLIAKYLRYESALQKADQAAALPDPQFSVGVFPRPMERFMGDQVAEFSVMQMFPWFGTLRAARSEAEFMADVRLEEYRDARTALNYALKSTWLELYLVGKKIAITNEDLRILQTLEQIAIGRVQSGDTGSGGSTFDRQERGETSRPADDDKRGMAGMQMRGSGNTDEPMQGMSSTGPMEMPGGGGGMIDVLRIRLRMQELQYTLQSLEESRQQLSLQYNLQLDRPADAPVTIHDTLLFADIQIQSFWSADTLLAMNPMLRMLGKERQALEAERVMQEKMGMPMFGIGLQSMVFRPRRNGELHTDGGQMLMPMATISLPVWRKKYRAAVREVDIRRETVIHESHDMTNQLITEYHDALRAFRDAVRNVTLFDEQAALTKQIQQLALTQYVATGMRFEELMDIQRQFLDLRIKTHEALVEGYLAIARIERIIGL